MRTYAKDRRKREGKKIVVLPSDRIIRRVDEAGTPQRNCRYDEADPNMNYCLYDAHFGCGIFAQYNDRAGVSSFLYTHSFKLRVARSQWLQGAAWVRLSRSS